MLSNQAYFECRRTTISRLFDENEVRILCVLSSESDRRRFSRWFVIAFWFREEINQFFRVCLSISCHFNPLYDERDSSDEYRSDGNKFSVFYERRSFFSQFPRHNRQHPQERASMPLVIFSGLPSSGKTTRAIQLQKALEAKVASSLRKFKIHVINDDALGINREVYRGMSTEVSL
jgi:hypothetical protein